MANSIVRLYDTQPINSPDDEVLMQTSRLPGIGAIRHLGKATVSYIKREATAQATDNAYRDRGAGNKMVLRVPNGTPMKAWKQDKNIAESRGCDLFFSKESKDRRYRIELEVNFADV